MNDMSKLSATTDIAAANPLAMLAGERRPDLLRDEVLGEIFAATVAERAAHPEAPRPEYYPPPYRGLQLVEHTDPEYSGSDCPTTDPYPVHS